MNTHKLNDDQIETIVSCLNASDAIEAITPAYENILRDLGQITPKTDRAEVVRIHALKRHYDDLLAILFAEIKND